MSLFLLFFLWDVENVACGLVYSDLWCELFPCFVLFLMGLLRLSPIFLFYLLWDVVGLDYDDLWCAYMSLFWWVFDDYILD